MTEHEKWITKAVQMAVDNVKNGNGGPFAAVVVKDGEMVATGVNATEKNNDPSAHAELIALREACQTLGRMDLSDCILYASGEPCPMCLGLAYWTRPKAIYYGCSKKEAAAVGLTDPLAHFYNEMNSPGGQRSIPFVQVKVDTALEPFKLLK